MTKRSTSNEDFDAKEQLYSLFYELTSEIKGKEIELDEDDYIENIKATKLSQIIGYLRETIHILIRRQADRRANSDLASLSSLPPGEMAAFEQALRGYEVNERRNIRRFYQVKLHKDALEAKIGEYIQLEREFEEMKVKMKYEEGKFMENDRKDNEILILRAENTNLKRAIGEIEKSNKEYVKELNEKDNEIDNLRASIDDLKSQVEHSQKDLNIFTNIHGQIITNGGKNAKCVFCGSALNKEAAQEKKDQPQLKLLNIKKPKTKLINQIQCNNLNSISGSATNAKVNSEFNTSKPLISISASTSKNKTHKHNNSMNMMLENKKKDILSKYIHQQSSLLNSSNGNTFNTSTKNTLLPFNPSQCPVINNYNLSSKRDQGSTRILLCKKPINLVNSKSLLNYSISKGGI